MFNYRIYKGNYKDNLIVDIDKTLIYGGMCEIKGRVWDAIPSSIISSILSWIEQKFRWYNINYKTLSTILNYGLQGKKITILTAREEIQSTIDLIHDIIPEWQELDLSIVQLGSYNPKVDKARYIYNNIKGSWVLIDDNISTLVYTYYNVPNGEVLHPEEL